MSLTILLLAFLPAVVQARREPEKSKREKALEAELDRARAEIERVLQRNEELVAELNQARAELYRVGQARIEERLNPLVLMPAQQVAFAQQQYAAQQAQANAQLAQYHQMQAMQNATPSYGQANSELWCNCVPARHDMLLGIAG